MAIERIEHTATLLPNGQLLVAGGLSHRHHNFKRLGPAELYDPASGTWTTTASLLPGRLEHTATLLANGQVLVAGGDSAYGVLAGSELYRSAP